MTLPARGVIYHAPGQGNLFWYSLYPWPMASDLFLTTCELLRTLSRAYCSCGDWHAGVPNWRHGCHPMRADTDLVSLAIQDTLWAIDWHLFADAHT